MISDELLEKMDIMILWTIQSIKAWKVLQESGALRGDTQLSDYTSEVLSEIQKKDLG